ncbi:12035_t:CDS:10, partial [Ambispora gerdemannii]
KIFKESKHMGRVKPRSTSAKSTKIIKTRWLEPSELKNLGVDYTKGNYSRQEDTLLIQALEDYKIASLFHIDLIEFFKKNKLQAQEIHQLIYGKNGKKGIHKNFWKEIGSVLQTRPLKSVTSHVQRMQHPYKNAGKWLPKDDALLKSLFKKHGSNWKKIGDAVGRTGLACRDRYRDFIESESTMTKGKWSDTEIKKLCDILDELIKNGEATDSTVPWNQVSEKMGFTRSQHQCREKWQRDLLIRYKREDFNESPKWTKEDSWTLVKKMWEVDVEDDVDIPWEDLANDPNWGPWTPEYLRRVWYGWRRSKQEYIDLSFPVFTEKIYFKFRTKKGVSDQRKQRKKVKVERESISAEFVEDSELEE